MLLHEVSSRCFTFVVSRLQRETELCMPVGHVSVFSTVNLFRVPKYIL